MCLYAVVSHTPHYACVSCRVSFKRSVPAGRVAPCQNCARPLVHAGHDFAPPRRRDVRAWSVVAAVLAAGLRYEGRSACGCDKEPRSRPRTRRELRVRRTAAARQGIPLAEALARPDPWSPADDAQDGTGPGRH
ncbi:hypothetical protein ACFYVL_06550 [Streptomyces sp. NPDC004111]|uniref:hypothetical protein n=1 Tax=Streptomyces sp. NPDC004111 TaxID=3364690 RepID=UPI0036B84F1A